MLVIRSDTRLSAIYFGEFMQIFDLHHARHLVKKLAESERGDPDAGYLKDKAETAASVTRAAGNSSAPGSTDLDPWLNRRWTSRFMAPPYRANELVSPARADFSVPSGEGDRA